MTSASPDKALEFSSDGFDVIILDYKMPEVNGAELAIQIKNKLGKTTPPLILFSSIGQVESTIRKEIDAIGFAGVLTKPAKSGILLDLLAKTLSADKPSSKEISLTSDSPVPSDKSDLSILLVDDNMINRKVGNKILRAQGYKPDVVTSGADAIERCNTHDYDVVLMDIEMPEMDGITATGIIRDQHNIDTRPYIVALTANAMASERERYLRSGMDDYLSKPIDVDALLATLKAANRFRELQASRSAS